MRLVPSAVSAVGSYVSGLDALRYPQFVIDKIEVVELMLPNLVELHSVRPSEAEGAWGSACYDLSTAIEFLGSLNPDFVDVVSCPESVRVLIRLHELLSAVFVE